jgi:hypothetical protein
MMERVVMHKYTCDGCGSEHLSLPNDIPAQGFHGKTTQHADWGGCTGEWFACQEKCIQKAVVKSIEKAWSES